MRIDVIEIDAASNRGINEMRELRENVRFRPARDRYKVFIVDEAHQITSEAFNALLKTLEEPPEWVVFILCTTESHKIPTTIASRCQQFSFRSVDFADLVARMAVDLQGRRHSNRRRSAGRARAGRRRQRPRFALGARSGHRLLRRQLTAREVRALLGCSRSSRWALWPRRSPTAIPPRCSTLCGELEAQRPQPAALRRELARYFRNLLVVRIAGNRNSADRSLRSGTGAAAEVASSFGEDDLTRYLQITLDLFKDLQASLQPRLHLEVGLLRLVHAGRLMSIEEALSMAGPVPASAPPAPVRSASQPAPRPPTARFTSPQAQASPAQTPQAPPPPPATLQATAPPGAGDLQRSLINALNDLGLQFIADAVAHSNVELKGNELIFVVAARADKMAIESDVPKVVQQVIGRVVKVTAKIGTPVSTGAIEMPPPPKKADESEVAERALAHPEVKRFTELFPDAHVRTVRNLKEP